MNFYEVTSKYMGELSTTEQNIVHYVLKNMDAVKQMTIRELADKCYVSATTLFRLVKKLGFNGYVDFLQALNQTNENKTAMQIPSIIYADHYRDNYLNNVVEAVKVITDDKMRRFYNIMEKQPRIYLLAQGPCEDVAKYFYRILSVLDFDVFLPLNDYEIQNMLNRVRSEDLLMVFSYSGKNQHLIHIMEQVSSCVTPTIMSITRSDNNAIQNMSNLNFYYFADEIQYADHDITSRCGMIAILETLLYRFVSEKEKA